VSVQCVINRTTHALIWELMSLASIEDWLTYLQNASHWQWLSDPGPRDCVHNVV
jgi:hypothetical protein